MSWELTSSHQEIYPSKKGHSPVKLLGFLALFLISSFAAAEPIKLRVSITSRADSTKARACFKFKELLEARSKKQILVEVHLEGKLYKDREELDALQLGAVEIVVPSYTKFVTIGVPEFSVFAIPYLFKTVQDVHTITDGHIGQQLSKLLELKGIKNLAYWDLGFNHFHASKPIHHPSDMKGLKFQVLRGKVIESMARALNTEPVPTARGAILDGYRRKLVDASSSPVANFYMDGFAPFQKHLSITSSSFHGYAVVTSTKFWSSLAPEAQSQIEKSILEATEYERKLAEVDTEQSLAKLKAQGLTEIYTPSEQELSAWRSALLPLQTRFRKEKEGTYIERIQEALSTSLK